VNGSCGKSRCKRYTYLFVPTSWFYPDSRVSRVQPRTLKIRSASQASSVMMCRFVWMEEGSGSMVQGMFLVFKTRLFDWSSCEARSAESAPLSALQSRAPPRSAASSLAAKVFWRFSSPQQNPHRKTHHSHRHHHQTLHPKQAILPLHVEMPTDCGSRAGSRQAALDGGVMTESGIPRCKSQGNTRHGKIKI
jgi:hypothetical protein